MISRTQISFLRDKNRLFALNGLNKMNAKNVYGGMALLEGVMMQGPKETAIAVRRADGTIALEVEQRKDYYKRFPFLKWPLIRGSYVLATAMITGLKALNKSANLAMDETEEELTTFEIVVSMTIAFVLAVLLFLVLPTAVVHFTSGYLGNVFMQNVVEGIIRVIFFLLYVYAISFMEDIARVFMYHGAEHKTIFTYEAGEELNVDNARKHSTLHPRCGTSFLFMVMIISIIVFALLGDGSLLYKIISRIVALPIIAGLGYEFTRWSGKNFGNKWANILILPGLYLQKLTTREPDDQQLEVALTALQAIYEVEAPA